MVEAMDAGEPSRPFFNATSRVSPSGMKPVVINTFGLLPSAWVLPPMSEDVDRSTLQISLLDLPETVAGAAAAHVRHVLRQHQPVLNAAAVSLPGAEGAFWVPWKGVAPTDLLVKRLGRDHIFGNVTRLHDVTPLETSPLLWPQQSVVTTDAYANAAAGFAASPLLLASIVPRTAKTAKVGKCLPFGLEGLAPTLDGRPIAEFPGYVGIDGGMAENTGIALLLGRMQQDCAKSPPAADFDCKTDLKVVYIGTAEPDALKKLFRQPGVMPGQLQGYLYGYVPRWAARLLPPLADWVNTTIMTSLPIVFNQAFSELAWTPFTDPFGPEGVQAKYWQGTLTTVDNDLYGVVGNYQVSTLLINADEFTALGATFLNAQTHDYFAKAGAAADFTVGPAAELIKRFLSRSR